MIKDIIMNMTNELRAIPQTPSNNASGSQKRNESSALLLKRITLKGINVTKP
jgi:hypothetical protein